MDGDRQIVFIKPSEIRENIMGVKKENPDNYMQEILDSVEAGRKIHQLEDLILELRRKMATQHEYINILEPRALEFDKLNTGDFKHLNYDFARTVVSFADALENKANDLISQTGNSDRLDKDLCQILTFAEGIRKTVKTDDFLDLQNLLESIDAQKFNQ